MVVIVSRNTGRQDVVGVPITNDRDEPFAADIVRVAEMDCHPRITGVVRCDQPYTLDVDDYEWGLQVTHLSPADMARIEDGLRAALSL